MDELVGTIVGLTYVSPHMFLAMWQLWFIACTNPIVNMSLCRSDSHVIGRD